MRLACGLAAALALAVAGCGETSEREPGGPPAETDTGPAERPDEAQDGALFVDQRRSDSAGARYIEGVVPYVEVVDGSRKIVIEQSFPRAPERGRLVRQTLPPGSYTVTTLVRPRSGADRLDAATDRCSAAVEVPSSGAVTATVARTAGEQCEIELERTTFGDLVGMDVEEARAIAQRRGFDLRVVERDGESLPVTLDLRFDRLNVAVRDGRVSGLRGIG